MKNIRDQYNKKFFSTNIFYRKSYIFVFNQKMEKKMTYIFRNYSFLLINSN